MPHDVDALNAGFAGQLLEQYLENPIPFPPSGARCSSRATRTSSPRSPASCACSRRSGAEPPWRNWLEPLPEPPTADEELLGGVAAAMALVKAHRMHGHLAAQLDPLGSEPPGDPALEPERLIPKLTPELQARIPARLLRTYVSGETLAEALPKLRETYCGTIAYEIEHISDHEERVWLREAIESGRYRTPPTRSARCSRG